MKQLVLMSVVFPVCLLGVGLPDVVSVEGVGFTNRLVRVPGEVEGRCVWRQGGVEVGLDGFGAVDVRAEREGLFAVNLEWPAAWSARARVLCDAWERSYGELGWRDLSVACESPWYFLVNDGARTDGYGVQVQPNALACWKVRRDARVLRLDVGAGGGPVRLAGRRLAVATIVERKGLADESAFAAGRAFCRQMCPRTPKLDEPVYGYNDWYCAYGRNTATNFLLDAEYIVACARGLANRPYVVMDDGWQRNSPPVVKNDSGRGPWDEAGRPFGMAMSDFARRMAALGAKPGLWYRPFRAWEEMPREWKLVEDDRYVDPTVPAVKEQIVRDVARFRDWGFRLVKIDYLTFDVTRVWGRGMTADRIFCGDRKWRDASRTTAEVLKDLYRTMKATAGDDVVIIGCNALNHLAAGLFEVQRIGDDTSGREWKRTKEMGVNTLAFRSIQDGIFFAADADCVGLASAGAVPWEKNSQWLDVVAASGTPLFVSWHRSLATDEFRAALSAAFQKASGRQATAEPLDWMETNHPARWRTAQGERTYVW